MGVARVVVTRNNLLQEMLSRNGMYLVTVHQGHMVKCQPVDKDNLPTGEARTAGGPDPGLVEITVLDPPGEPQAKAAPVPKNGANTTRSRKTGKS